MERFFTFLMYVAAGIAITCAAILLLIVTVAIVMSFGGTLGWWVSPI